MTKTDYLGYLWPAKTGSIVQRGWPLASIDISTSLAEELHLKQARKQWESLQSLENNVHLLHWPHSSNLHKPSPDKGGQEIRMY